MATTTNYGWTTPDDTALVKDGASAIRTLGSSVDTTTKALNPSTTLGDIEYRSSTANTNTRLGIGSTGQVLTVAGGVPSWATPASGGKVLQVVQQVMTTQANSTSSSYAATGVTLAITPSAITSKILVIVSMTGLQRDASGASDNGINLRLRRATGSVTLGTITRIGQTGTVLAMNDCASLTYLDSPATTSATTYDVQFACFNTPGSIYVSWQSTPSTITLMEIGA